MKTLIAAFSLLMLGLIAAAFTMSTDSNESPSVAEVGKAAPTFTLMDADGKKVTLSDFKGKVVVLEWTNPGCPFVVAHYKSGNMQGLQKKYTEKGVIWLTMNSTNTDHKDYLNGEKAKSKFGEWNASYTKYLMDANGEVGKTYGAKTTPHMFVIGADGTLLYQGAIDDKESASDGGQTAGVNFVSKALDEVLSGKAVSQNSTRPYGCSVKYAAK